MYRAVPELRKRSPDSDGKCQIMLRLQTGGTRAYISTGLKVRPSQWKGNGKRHPVRSGSKHSKRFNAIISSRVEDAETAALEADFRGRTLNAKQWKALIERDARGGTRTGSDGDFFSFAYGWIEQLRAEGQINYWKRVRSIVRKFDEYCGGGLKWVDFTPALLEGFNAWMRDVRENSGNTRHGAFKVLTTITRRAMKRGLLGRDQDPFFEFDKPEKKPTKKVSLTVEEVAALEQLDNFPSEWERIARDVFLTCIYARGARFSDVIRFKWENIQNGRLHYTMRKNLANVSVPYSGKLYSRVEPYRGMTADYIFPPLDGKTFTDPESEISAVSSANAHLNKELKKVAVRAGIRKHLSMHSGRHTFASVAKRSGTSIHVIKEALKHADTQTTEIYLASLTDEDLDADLDGLF